MPKFNVHIFRIVRIKVDPIEADTMEQAIEKAEDQLGYMKHGANAFFNWHFFQEPPVSGVEIIEDAEETSHYLVDIEGDENNEDSHFFMADGVTWATGENNPSFFGLKEPLKLD